MSSQNINRSDGDITNEDFMFNPATTSGKSSHFMHHEHLSRSNQYKSFHFQDPNGTSATPPAIQRSVSRNVRSPGLFKGRTRNDSELSWANDGMSSRQQSLVYNKYGNYNGQALLPVDRGSHHESATSLIKGSHSDYSMSFDNACHLLEGLRSDVERLQSQFSQEIESLKTKIAQVEEFVHRGSYMNWPSNESILLGKSCNMNSSFNQDHKVENQVSDCETVALVVVDLERRKEEITREEQKEANKVVIHLKTDKFTEEQVKSDMMSRCPSIFDNLVSVQVYDKSKTMIFTYSNVKAAQDASQKLQNNLRELANKGGHAALLKSVGISKPPSIRELRQWSQKVKERSSSLPIVVYAEMPVLGKVFPEGRKELHNIRLNWIVSGVPKVDTVVLFIDSATVISKPVSVLESEGWIDTLVEKEQWPEFANSIDRK